MHVSEENRNACDASSAAQNSFGNCSDFEPRREEGGGDACGMLCIPPSLLRGKSGLSRVDLALLAYIIENPEKQGSRTEIAEDCQCAANSVPRSAKKLEALGWIERAPGGGAQHTAYKLGRNLQVTTRNMEVTRNAEVTAVETSKLRAVFGGKQTETTTTDMVVTADVETRNNPPPHPPNNTNSLFEDNHQPSEPSFEGGLGELFGDERPKRVRRKQAAKFVASDETLPPQLTPEMREIAIEARLINGTCDQQFAQWRRWHIRERTVMTYPARSWQTWVNNWAKRNQPSVDGVPRGYKLAGYGPDGAARYVKDQRANVYR